ncbi:hypothetical protein HYE59_06170 [Aggregatibacter actinomycetemcomitans]|uniref:hypothetical protein n=1 Tax=Aggregatibacter actinomycetemcomitans TaxID=714 RepID=UPI00197BCA9C|nr:hypothetical protein [Aggregatibacter actinomycetemcomitans]MBN6077125.1 hypothetical protein [Aggregatibacter actinomycetemcomitans]
MIPIEIINSFKENNIPYKREDVEEAVRILSKLGLHQNDEVFEYYSNIYGGNIINPRMTDEIIDIADDSIFDTLDYVRERYELPEHFIPLTSDESEGMYLYSKLDKKVYNFNMESYEEITNNLIPKWNSFYEFILWYIEK